MDSRLDDPLPRAAPPRANRRAPLRRAAIHGGLLVLTFLTLADAGGRYWHPADATRERLLASLPLFEAWLARLGDGVPYAVSVLLILGAHEMGHYLACRAHRIPATLPYFIPGPLVLLGSFGALIRIRGRIPDRRALFDVAAAGPLAGFVAALPILALGLSIAEPPPEVPFDAAAEGWSLGKPLLREILGAVLGAPRTIEVNPYYGAAWFGLLVTSLNLFPVGQLDGGHAAYAVSPRLHRALAWCTIGAVATLVATQAARGEIPAYLVWLLVLLWMRDRHPPVFDPAGRLGHARLALASFLVLLFASCFVAAPFRLL